MPISEGQNPSGHRTSRPARDQPSRWTLEPFLHFETGRIYNPLSDRSLSSAETEFEPLVGLRQGHHTVADVDPDVLETLVASQWLIDSPEAEVGRRFRLKYVSLEANSACNQACYFCPVSTNPRPDHTMSLEFYEEIVRQLSLYGSTIEAVSMVHYNEPTVDPWFLERVAILMRHGLGVGVLTNGTGLTPKRIDALAEMGDLHYLSVNLSTLDRDQYARDRRADHLDVVLENLDALHGRRIARQMDLVVLGRADEAHHAALAEVKARFEDSPFEIKDYEVMDRAGNVPLGLRPPSPHRRLCGCDQTGSRPVQWVHITPHGKCVLCCQDYHETYVIGDLRENTLDEVLSGPRMATLRRWAYGLDEAPGDFICRHCVFAVTR